MARSRSLTDEQMQAIARALADPRRFAILQQIASHTECTQCSALHEQQILSPATISHHLKELAEAGLIDVRREGRTAALSLRRETWNAYLAGLARI
ncbi:MAG TPA: helix-turn-helix domain-containing protein [Acidobacteriaceae bacterium]|jgi:ArsR family transcriptional regulator|nr:helix-turn-helix domain-containing protein [Acidobacteriaceae bacterium]